MFDLKKLGVAAPVEATPMPYEPGLRHAPPPKTLTLRRGPMISFSKGPRHGDDEMSMEAGAVIGGLAASLNQLDHLARRAYDLGLFKQDVKFALGKLVQLTDATLATYSQKFSNADADAANRQGNVLGQGAELLMKLSPRQIKSSLQHMHEMAEHNMTYVPVPVAMRGLLPVADGWRLVAVETPYEGDVTHNLKYLRACLRDCLRHRETPLAAHGLLTQPGVFDPENEAERQLADEAGIAWTQYAEATIVYTDLGLTPRMQAAIGRAENEGREVEYRSLPEWLPEGEAIELVEVVTE